MSRWEVYSFLKEVNGKTKVKTLKAAFPEMSETELIEGVIEYNIMAVRSLGLYETSVVET